MTIQSTPTTGRTSVSEPVFLLHHTHSNAEGVVVTYYAGPDISGIKLSPYTFDVSATITCAFYATAFEAGYFMGVAR